jgi:hypothetical protein
VGEGGLSAVKAIAADAATETTPRASHLALPVKGSTTIGAWPRTCRCACSLSLRARYPLALCYVPGPPRPRATAGRTSMPVCPASAPVRSAASGPACACACRQTRFIASSQGDRSNPLAHAARRARGRDYQTRAPIGVPHPRDARGSHADLTRTSRGTVRPSTRRPGGCVRRPATAVRPLSHFLFAAHAPGGRVYLDPRPGIYGPPAPARRARASKPPRRDLRPA